MRNKKLILSFSIVLISLIILIRKQMIAPGSSPITNENKPFSKVAKLEKVKFYKKNQSNRKIKNNIQHIEKNKKVLYQIKINKHLESIHQIAENSDENYQKSLDELKKDKENITLLLWENYQELEEGNYLARQKIIETIRALHSKNSIPILNELALDKMPEEKSSDDDHGSTRLEEGIIRLTAIEGLGYFSKKGNIETLQTLLDIIKSTDSPLPLKRQATREYLLSSNGPQSLQNNKQMLKEVLDPKIHFIITDQIDSPEEQLPELEHMIKKLKEGEQSFPPQVHKNHHH